MTFATLEVYAALVSTRQDPIARLEEMEAKAALAGGKARIDKQHEAGKLRIVVAETYPFPKARKAKRRELALPEGDPAPKRAASATKRLE